jgi:hypothetical protein
MTRRYQDHLDAGRNQVWLMEHYSRIERLDCLLDRSELAIWPRDMRGTISRSAISVFAC